MKSFTRAFLYGLAVWAIPFVVAIFIFPLRENERPLFESIMPVAVALGVVIFGKVYFGKLDMNFLKEGILLGFLWFIINIAIDLLLFSWGPMKMSFVDYMKDIGITYFMIPVITIGIGWIEENRFKKLIKGVPPAP
jgi:hypothetical protein